MTQHIVIVGGGMVGSALALALGQIAGLRVSLIEAHPPVALSADSSPDLRVSAINPSSQQWLEQLGVWHALMEDRLGPFERMQVWSGRHGQLAFDAADIGAPWLGQIVENRHLQQAAFQQLKQQPEIALLCPATPTRLEEQTLHLDDGRTLQADLIVAADGAQSRIREWADIPVSRRDYGQQGLVCQISTRHSHQQTARQRFLKDGPLAFLPLADPHQCSIVWSLPDPQAKNLLQQPVADFKKALMEAFELPPDEITDVSERAAFPLFAQHAGQYVKPGIVLVGDAAHSVHPLAGQGVNIGFRDAATLTAIITEAVHSKRSVGSLHTLRKYERRRRGDNLVMQETLSALNALFSSSLPGVGPLRELGLRLVDHNQLLKRCFMRQAAGHPIK